MPVHQNVPILLGSLPFIKDLALAVVLAFFADYVTKHWDETLKPWIKALDATNPVVLFTVMVMADTTAMAIFQYFQTA